MSIKVNNSSDGKSVTIAVSGSFQFSLHREFRDSYASITQSGTEFRINLSATEYMDSSALGMLLLLKEHATKHQGSVVIAGVTPAIRRVLEIASFDKLFRIEA